MVSATVSKAKEFLLRTVPIVQYGLVGEISLQLPSALCHEHSFEHGQVLLCWLVTQQLPGVGPACTGMTVGYAFVPSVRLLARQDAVSAVYFGGFRQGLRQRDPLSLQGLCLCFGHSEM